MTKYNVSPLVAREIEFSTGTIISATWCRESDAFEQYVIEFINSHWDEHHPLKELNPNHHYMSNSYGDTIQVHFNDESLFIIITMTGQY